jgi:uncharacterized membrane protein YjjB (DUF3815 family)
MYYLVQGCYTEFGNSSNKVLMEAGAIALGIILASYVTKFVVRKPVRNKRIKMEAKKWETR